MTVVLPIAMIFAVLATTTSAIADPKTRHTIDWFVLFPLTIGLITIWMISAFR